MHATLLSLGFHFKMSFFVSFLFCFYFPLLSSVLSDLCSDRIVRYVAVVYQGQTERKQILPSLLCPGGTRQTYVREINKSRGDIELFVTRLLLMRRLPSKRVPKSKARR